MNVRVGVSACLLGRAVRWDGGHRHDDWIVGTLATRVTLVPVCPETEIGLGTPREPIRLVDVRGQIRLLGVRSGADHTAPMRRWAEDRLSALAGEGLSGFVLQSGSPSCGVGGVAVFDPDGRVLGSAAGLFAEDLRSRFPDLPVAQETDLATPDARERFLELVLGGDREPRTDETGS